MKYWQTMTLAAISGAIITYWLGTLVPQLDRGFTFLFAFAIIGLGIALKRGK